MKHYYANIFSSENFHQKKLVWSAFFFTFQTSSKALKIAKKILKLSIFAFYVNALWMRIIYNFVNIFFAENIHGMEQVVKIWQFFSFSLILLRIEKPIQKTIIYKQMKKKKNLPPTFTHRSGNWKPTTFAYSPILTLHSPIQKLNQVKC